MLAIKVEIMGGTMIAEAAAEMIALARRLDALIEGQFNEVSLYVRPGDSPEDVVERYLGHDRQVREARAADK